MSRRILNVGVLGYADVFKKHMKNAFEKSEYYIIKKIGSRNTENILDLEKLSKEGLCITSYEDVINDQEIDLVYIPLPNSLHFEWICKALEMGKHILVEKPIVLNRFELDYVADLANRSNLIIKQNFMFEYHSQFKFIQREIKNGRIGELRSVKSSFGFPPFKDNENIRYNLSLGGGALNDAGAYGIKMSTLLLDFTDNFSVFSGLNIDKVRNVDLFGSAYLIDKNGVHAHIDFGFDNFYQCELTIWGSKGRISANRIFTAGPGVQPKIIIETNDEEEVIKFESENHFIKIIEQLYYDIIAENFDLEVKRNLEFVQLLEEIRDKAVINYIC
jgi:NDP-hexose-3-ketoreductase